MALTVDLTDAEQLDGFAAACLAELGHVDVLVNNAGLETTDAFVETDRDQIRRVLRLNLEATMLLTRDLIGPMLARDSGHIVQMSSLAGAITFPGLTAYAGTKAGVTPFTESLRLELHGTGIGLTVVLTRSGGHRHVGPPRRGRQPVRPPGAAALPPDVLPPQGQPRSDRRRHGARR